MTNEPTVFIVDDDPAARESVAALVQSKGVAAETFASAADFLAAYDPARPGCLVTDVRMEGIDGLQLQEQLKALGSLLPVIVITAFADVPLAVRAMRTGAITVLQKPSLHHELWENIRLALQRDALDRQRKARLDEIRSRLALLTPDEHEVLKRIVAGQANKVIASELEIGLRTVELRRANIMEKMQCDSLAELVQMVMAVRGNAHEPPPAASS
jgi:FixJ family two-component response regulator